VDGRNKEKEKEMKVGDIYQLGLCRKTIDEATIDPTDLIRQDEFNRDGKGDYRERTIDRLVRERIGFHSDCNTLFNFMKRFVRIVCPYCKKTMEPHAASGNGETTTTGYVCPKCGATASISLPSTGIYFAPKKTNNQ
jgi:DNA-directed RNA polymerase subunit RPC12/RpoP